MTDQRPIDPSTLRDGDIVRAKRGEHGVVEGAFHPFAISDEREAQENEEQQ